MKNQRLYYAVPFMCRMLNVSPSGYYAWLKCPISKRAQEEARLEIEIKAAHKRNREVAGPETIQRDLAEHGIKVGICRIRKIRKKLGIRCKLKGTEFDIDHAKYQAARRWVSAVNNWGRLGRWDFMVCKDPLALPGMLTKAE